MAAAEDNSAEKLRNFNFKIKISHNAVEHPQIAALCTKKKKNDRTGLRPWGVSTPKDDGKMLLVCACITANANGVSQCCFVRLNDEVLLMVDPTKGK